MKKHEFWTLLQTAVIIIWKMEVFSEDDLRDEDLQDGELRQESSVQIITVVK